MSDRLTTERKAEIIAHLAATTNWSLGNLAARDLVAELAAVRAERDQARESLDFLERNTLPDLRRQIQHHQDGKQRWRDRAEKAEARVAELEENLRAVNAGWSVSRARVAELEAAQQPATEDDASDNRRRLYIDGKGRAWIDASIDSGGLQWIAPIDDAAMEATREAVNAETGSLREIGRCW